MNDTTKTTRIAVPSELPGGLEAQRAGHFGRCACFTLVDLAEHAGKTRRGAVCRELTKAYEEVARGTLAELAARFADGTRGEVTIIRRLGARSWTSPHLREKSCPASSTTTRLWLSVD